MQPWLWSPVFKFKTSVDIRILPCLCPLASWNWISCKSVNYFFFMLHTFFLSSSSSSSSSSAAAAEPKSRFAAMRDGQGCLLPVLRCHAQGLLLEEDKVLSSLPGLLPKSCRAEVGSFLFEGRSSTEKRKRLKRGKAKTPVKDAPKYEGRVPLEQVPEKTSCSEVHLVTKASAQPIIGAEWVSSSPSLPHQMLKKALDTQCTVKTGVLDIQEQSIAYCPAQNKQSRSVKQVMVKDGSRKCQLRNCSGANDELLTLATKSVCHSSTSQNMADQNDDPSYIPGLDDNTALRCLAHISRSVHGRLAMLNHKYMQLVRSSLLFEHRRQYSVVEQWVCIYTSGSSGWTAFDPKQKQWRNLPPAEVDPSFHLSDRESLSAGTHLLWLGREAFEFACYKYDLITNDWERGPPMVNPRCLFASASCGEFAFVAGGYSLGGGLLSVLNTAEKYDSRTGTWSELPPMMIPRQKCSGFFMDGKFFVIGGKDKDHQPITSGEEYDISRKTWRLIDNMYSAPAAQPLMEPSPPLVAVAGNELYAIESSSNLLKHYEKKTNTWKVLGTVPVRADFCNGWGLAFKALGDELFVIGGHRDSTWNQEGVAVFSWRPQPDDTDPDWQLVDSCLSTGTFLYNCAVMAC